MITESQKLEISTNKPYKLDIPLFDNRSNEDNGARFSGVNSFIPLNVVATKVHRPMDGFINDFFFTYQSRRLSGGSSFPLKDINEFLLRVFFLRVTQSFIFQRNKRVSVPSVIGTSTVINKRIIFYGTDNEFVDQNGKVFMRMALLPKKVASLYKKFTTGGFDEVTNYIEQNIFPQDIYLLINKELITDEALNKLVFKEFNANFLPIILERGINVVYVNDIESLSNTPSALVVPEFSSLEEEEEYKQELLTLAYG